MTRCECVGVSFDDLARLLRDDGLSFEELAERTGCGRLCTACLPDLREHVAPPR
jgi:bacterioferritin-associated ferredoxin